MRKSTSNGSICVQAVAGIHVVMLGMDVVTEAAREGLLGFTIRRSGGGRQKTLGGGLVFEGVSAETLENVSIAVDSGPTRAPEAPPHRQRSDEAPIQAFLWGDYTALPGITYTYSIIPNYGSPEQLEPRPGVEVTVTTEKNDDGIHGVFFNRGVAGSQSYARRFGKYRRSYLVDDKWKSFIKPEDVPDKEAYKWLSRGLEEGMINFLRQAKDASYSLHASVYEFSYLPVIREFIAALERGADVKIVHHAKEKTSYSTKRNYDKKLILRDDPREGDPTEADIEFNNRTIIKGKVLDPVAIATHKAIRRSGLRSNHGQGNKHLEKVFNEMLFPRTYPSISHNKFIVLLKDGKPIQVWTGSTNFTEGGIFGQSNVGHQIRDEKAAQAYHNYWLELKENPVNKKIKKWTVDQGGPEQLPELPKGITPVFSPRANEDLLQWYADQIGKATHSIHLTSAFTISKPFLERLQDGAAADDDPNTPYLRYVLLEGNTGLLRDKVKAIRGVPLNRVAWGDTLKKRRKSEELTESLTGLNSHVNYLHTKYMLIDPLTDDPIIITGSANFSSASTVKNDENMVVIRGNTRVADIFVGEFMRLFNHFKVRNKLNAQKVNIAHNNFLKPDDSWTNPYFTPSHSLYQERLLFSAKTAPGFKESTIQDLTAKALDLDYYMFDWDDNILFMPTRIYLEKEGHPVTVTTKQFATIRKDHSYTIPKDAFREFRDGTGDFVCDTRVAIAGRRRAPSYEAFKTALREARLFCIVTARGHSAGVLRKGVEVFIQEALTIEERLEMIDNIQKYNRLAGVEMDDEACISHYLNLNGYMGVSSPDFLKAFQSSGAINGEEKAASSPEEMKTFAVQQFVEHTLVLANNLQQQNKKISFGFSDDDLGNLNKMREFLEEELKKEYEEVEFFVYDTSSGKKVKREHL